MSQLELGELKQWTVEELKMWLWEQDIQPVLRYHVELWVKPPAKPPNPGIVHGDTLHEALVEAVSAVMRSAAGEGN